MTVDGDVARKVLLYKGARGGVVWQLNAFRTLLRRWQLEDCMAVEEIPEGSVKKGNGFVGEQGGDARSTVKTWLRWYQAASEPKRDRQHDDLVNQGVDRPSVPSPPVPPSGGTTREAPLEPLRNPFFWGARCRLGPSREELASAIRKGPSHDSGTSSVPVRGGFL